MDQAVNCCSVETNVECSSTRWRGNFEKIEFKFGRKDEVSRRTCAHGLSERKYKKPREQLHILQSNVFEEARS